VVTYCIAEKLTRVKIKKALNQIRCYPSKQQLQNN